MTSQHDQSPSNGVDYFVRFCNVQRWNLAAGSAELNLSDPPTVSSIDIARLMLQFLWFSGQQSYVCNACCLISAELFDDTTSGIVQTLSSESDLAANDVEQCDGADARNTSPVLCQSHALPSSIMDLHLYDIYSFSPRLTHGKCLEHIKDMDFT